MAAAVAALRTALGRMGLPNDAAQYATTTMNLDTLDAWRDFQTDSDLDGLAKNLRSPGGTMVLPNGTTIRHPGFAVSVQAISNIKVMRVALKHHQHIQRAVTADQVTAEWIAEWKFLIDYHKEAAKTKIDDAVLPEVVMSDWAKTKEKIVTFLDGMYGQEGVPLSYVVREDAEVPAEADDPPANYEDGDGTRDHVKELIARAPHEGAMYNADNRSVCQLLKKICEKHAAYDYISKYTANGRQAWKDLMQVYLGPQHTTNQATIWEAKLQQSSYDGESARWSFEKLVALQKKAHSRLDGLEKYGYKGMDEGTKIRYLLNAIKTDKLKTVVELIRGNPAYDTFDKAARRIQDSVVTQRPSKKSRQIAAVSTKTLDERYPGVQADMKMEDKYYPTKEWVKLTKAQQKGVLMKRKRRNQGQANGGGGGGGGDGGGNSNQGDLKKKLKNANKRIAALELKIGAVTIQDGDDEGVDSGESSGDEEPPRKKKKKNRTNPATTRRS